jgi:hypothetical protein
MPRMRRNSHFSCREATHVDLIAQAQPDGTRSRSRILIMSLPAQKYAGTWRADRNDTYYMWPITDPCLDHLQPRDRGCTSMHRSKSRTILRQHDDLD